MASSASSLLHKCGSVYLQSRSQAEVQFTVHSNSPVPAAPGNQALSMTLINSDLKNRACPQETDLLYLLQCPRGLPLLHPAPECLSFLSMAGLPWVQKTCMLSSRHPTVDPNSALNRACVFRRSCSQFFGGISQVCVCYLSHCCHKIPGKHNLRKEGLPWLVV